MCTPKVKPDNLLHLIAHGELHVRQDATCTLDMHPGAAKAAAHHLLLSLLVADQAVPRLAVAYVSVAGRSSGWQSLIGGTLDIEVLGEGAIAGRHFFTSGTKLFGSHHVWMSTLKELVPMMTTCLQQVELSTIQHNTAGPRRLPAETRCDKIRKYNLPYNRAFTTRLMS